jgi:hypothetical protein
MSSSFSGICPYVPLWLFVYPWMGKHCGMMVHETCSMIVYFLIVVHLFDQSLYNYLTCGTWIILKTSEYLAHIRDVPSSVRHRCPQPSIQFLTSSLNPSRKCSLYRYRETATTTSFVVLLISLFVITLNIRRFITSAIAKHILIKQEMNSKPEGRKAV